MQPQRVRRRKTQRFNFCHGSCQICEADSTKSIWHLPLLVAYLHCYWLVRISDAKPLSLSRSAELEEAKRRNSTTSLSSASLIPSPSHHDTMKFYKSSYDYSYPFPTVTLAYFLRYPNPYSRHVLSTDVIDRYVDPETHRLHTVRLHLKKSKVPSAILKLLPRGLAGSEGKSQSFILEKSTVDLKEGWMETESKNMEWTGILSVIEKQVYKRWQMAKDEGTGKIMDWTSCKTTVTFVSKIGQGKMKRRTESSTTSEQEPPKLGWLSAWSTAGIQRTVELVGVKRTQTALVNGKEGMNVVLERLRNGGVLAVLEGMRRDGKETMGGTTEGGWRQIWSKGQAGDHD